MGPDALPFATTTLFLLLAVLLHAEILKGDHETLESLFIQETKEDDAGRYMCNDSPIRQNNRQARS